MESFGITGTTTDVTMATGGVPTTTAGLSTTITLSTDNYTLVSTATDGVNVTMSEVLNTTPTAIHDGGDGWTYSFEDYTQRAIISIIICLVSLSGFVGNTMVITAVVLSKKLQTRTNAFVVNLAFADLALLSVVGWPLPEIVCSVAAAIGFSSLGCSVINLAAIAVNRFVLITKPTQTYRTIYTPRKIAAMLVFTWVYPALVCSLPLFGIGKWGYSDKYKTCTQDTSHEYSDLFSLLATLLLIMVPLVVLFVCYYKIYRHVTGHMKKMRGKASKEIEMSDKPSNSSIASTSQLQKNPPANFSKAQVEITKNLFYVVCAFIACLAPFAVAVMIPPSDPVIPWTGTILIFNSAVNPVIYGLKHPRFKVVFRHMIRCQYHMIPEPSGCLRKIRSR